MSYLFDEDSSEGEGAGSDTSDARPSAKKQKTRTPVIPSDDGKIRYSLCLYHLIII